MNLLIVILNYRTPELTVNCLRSLASQIADVPDARVVVVDNGSNDGSADVIGRAISAHHWHEWATLRVSRRNLGFAAGNNWGVRLAGISRYILLLNSDTLVHAGTLRYCFDAMERDRHIGAMSCALLSPDGSVQNVARRFPHPLRETVVTLGLAWHWPRLFGWADGEDLTWDRRTERRDVQWIGGAFLLVRGQLYRRLGGFDERFFFYGEDVDLCHRINRLGYRCRYDPGAAITHFGGASSDQPNAAHERSAQYWRSKYLVQRKLYGRWAAWWLRGVDLTNAAMRSAALLCTGRYQPDRHAGYLASVRQLARPL